VHLVHYQESNCYGHLSPILSMVSTRARHDFVNVTRFILIKWTKGKLFCCGRLLWFDC
jgi:hypothetical protein